VTILDRDLVTVSGTDAFSFLQSLVSQDVDGLADGAVVSSLLLTPKGKVDSWFRLARVGGAAWLDVEAGFGDALAGSLQRFLLRVDAEIGRPAEPWGMVAIRDGEDAVPAPPRGLVIPVTVGGPARGFDVIGPRVELGGIAARGLDADTYERARIAAGVPRLGLDLDDNTIPQEAWLDRDSVSFTKGCFLGQELVARLDSRGHVNRHLRRIDARDDQLVLARGADVEVDGKVVGTVTSAVAGGALGYVRREVTVPAAGTVTGAPVTIQATIPSGSGRP
jgi:folate-binding protein YgfZ